MFSPSKVFHCTVINCNNHLKVTGDSSPMRRHFPLSVMEHTKKTINENGASSFTKIASPLTVKKY